MKHALAASLLAILLTGVSLSAEPAPDTTSERVGRASANRTVLPVNQVVTPLGLQIDLPGLRPQVLALSPDGKLLVVSGKTSELVVLDPVSGEVRQRVALPDEKVNEPNRRPFHRTSSPRTRKGR